MRVLLLGTSNSPNYRAQADEMGVRGHEVIAAGYQSPLFPPARGGVGWEVAPGWLPSFKPTVARRQGRG